MDTYSCITNPADREKINDILITEKHLADTYNTFTNEASSRNLHEDLLSILREEHELEFKIFQEIQKRGWYTVECVNQSDIDNVKQKYSRMS